MKYIWASLCPISGQWACSAFPEITSIFAQPSHAAVENCSCKANKAKILFNHFLVNRKFFPYFWFSHILFPQFLCRLNYTIYLYCDKFDWILFVLDCIRARLHYKSCTACKITLNSLFTREVDSSYWTLELIHVCLCCCRSNCKVLMHVSCL